MKERIKILHVFGAMERGGAETRTLEIMRHIDRSKYDFHFAVNKPGSLDEEVLSLGGTIHCRPMKKHDPFYASWFRKMLRRERFDVVHSHIHYTSGYIVRLAHQAGIPQRIVHFRNTHDGKRQTVLRKLQLQLMRNWIDLHATCILAVSNSAMAESWPTYQNDPRCQVIYNGLDLTPFRKTLDQQECRRELCFTEKDIVIIHVGRHGKQKNCSRLLQIFAKIKEKLPNAKLLMVGIGSNLAEREISLLIKKLELEHFVQRVGRRSDIPRLLSAADMMLFPSLWEGLPGAVLEACAVGLPILASNIASNREIERHFPNVVCLSLGESDEKWSETANSMIISSKKACMEKEKSVEFFSRSPFSLPENIKQLCQKWQGNIERDAA